MHILLYPFMLLSAAGLALSLAAHVMALFGLQPPGGQLVWTLHAGIFVVWLPAVLVSIRTTRYASRKDFWKVVLSGCPPWMRSAFYALFAYAIVNFIVFAVSTANGSHHTAEASASTVRGFSGHWMIFYGAAFAIFYSAIHAPRLFHGRKCSHGHEVGPSAHFCPECGHAFSDAANQI